MGQHHGHVGQCALRGVPDARDRLSGQREELEAAAGLGGGKFRDAGCPEADITAALRAHLAAEKLDLPPLEEEAAGAKEEGEKEEGEKEEGEKKEGEAVAA